MGSSTRLTKRIGPLLLDLRKGLQEAFGDRLHGVYLYGSYARGEADIESDVDVLIVLDRVVRYGADLDRSSQLISDLSLKYGVSISRVLVSEEDWANRQSPFLLNVRDEAVPA